jgi:hypothetical protein
LLPARLEVESEGQDGKKKREGSGKSRRKKGCFAAPEVDWQQREDEELRTCPVWLWRWRERGRWRRGEKDGGGKGKVEGRKGKENGGVSRERDREEVV